MVLVLVMPSLCLAQATRVMVLHVQLGYWSSPTRLPNCVTCTHTRTPLPSSLQILPTCVFNKKDPIVVGVDVKEGIARVGTPLAVPTKGGLELGRIASLELNHKVRLTAVWRVGTWQCGNFLGPSGACRQQCCRR